MVVAWARPQPPAEQGPQDTPSVHRKGRNQVEEAHTRLTSINSFSKYPPIVPWDEPRRVPAGSGPSMLRRWRNSPRDRPGQSTARPPAPRGSRRGRAHSTDRIKRDILGLDPEPSRHQGMPELVEQDASEDVTGGQGPPTRSTPGSKTSKKVGCRNTSIPATRPSFQEANIEIVTLSPEVFPSGS